MKQGHWSDTQVVQASAATRATSTRTRTTATSLSTAQRLGAASLAFRRFLAISKSAAKKSDAVTQRNPNTGKGNDSP